MNLNPLTLVSHYLMNRYLSSAVLAIVGGGWISARAQQDTVRVLMDYCKGVRFGSSMEARLPSDI
jgi:hypothetical protein